MKKSIKLTILLLMATTLLLQPGCAKEPEAVTSESNRWPELLRVLPENEYSLKGAFLQDEGYKQLYSQDKDETLFLKIMPMLVLSTPYSEAEWQETLGFTRADITQTILAQADDNRLQYYQAVRGQFSQEEVENAAKTGPLNEHLETMTYRGVEFYGWGEDDDIHMDWRSGVRKIGRGHRLAYIGDFACWVIWTDEVKEMIDSYKGKVKSLADNEDYRLLAEVLEEMGTVTAFFSAESQSITHVMEIHKEELDELRDEGQEQFIKEIENEPLLKPYQALAAGAGMDENGTYLIIALANPSEAATKENVGLLEQRINESKVFWKSGGDRKWMDSIESFDIKSQGRLTVAKLYGVVFTNWADFEVSRGLRRSYRPLLMHE
ncbi:hypothetical protein ACFLUP_01615 [Chloroflexota bacterium]